MSLPVLAADVFVLDLPSYKVPYRAPLTYPAYYPDYGLPSRVSSPVVASAFANKVPRFKYPEASPIAWQRRAMGTYGAPIELVQFAKSFADAPSRFERTSGLVPNSHLSQMVHSAPRAYRALGARRNQDPRMTRRYPFGVSVPAAHAPYHECR